jgi:hypothetical protein
MELRCPPIFEFLMLVLGVAGVAGVSVRAIWRQNPGALPGIANEEEGE